MPLHILTISTPTHAGIWGRSWSQDFTLPGKVRRINGVVACANISDTTYLERRLNNACIRNDDYPDLYLTNELTNNIAWNRGKTLTTTTGEPTMTNYKLVTSPRTTLLGSFALTIGGSGIVCEEQPIHALAERNLSSTFSQNLIKLDTPIYVAPGISARITVEETEFCPFLPASEYAADFGIKSNECPSGNVVPLIWQYWENRKGVQNTYDYDLKIYIDYD